MVTETDEHEHEHEPLAGERCGMPGGVVPSDDLALGALQFSADLVPTVATRSAEKRTLQWVTPTSTVAAGLATRS